MKESIDRDDTAQKVMGVCLGVLGLFVLGFSIVSAAGTLICGVAGFCLLESGYRVYRDTIHELGHPAADRAFEAGSPLLLLLSVVITVVMWVIVARVVASTMRGHPGEWNPLGLFALLLMLGTFPIVFRYAVYFSLAVTYGKNVLFKWFCK